MSAALLCAGLFLSWNWLVWWALTRVLIGVRHPPALCEEPLDPARQAVAILSLVLFALTFVPIPVSFSLRPGAWPGALQPGPVDGIHSPPS
jgi:hypothetical protein